MQAFVYLRVSTPRQAESGVSISREDDDCGFQEARCRELCQYKRWEVADVYIDPGITGRSKGLSKRGALARCFKDASKARGVVVMYALSRLSRSARDLYNLTHELEQAGGHFATTCEDIDTSTAMGKAFFGLCAVFAQLESDQISERATATHRHMKAKLGFNPMAKQPYGWRYEDGKRLPIESEQAVIALAWRLRLDRTVGPPVSFEVVAAKMDEMGLRTRKGSVWHPGAVRRILLGNACPAEVKPS
jgi:DNA invertase Pin-like site-specific DNA recombinase